MRSRVAGRPAASAGIRWLALPLLTLAAWGCCPECPPPCPDPALHAEAPADAALGAASTDPTVTLVTVDQGCVVSDMSPTISKGGNGAIQWHNAGSEAITITLIGSPVGIELAPGAYSNVQRLTENVSVGQSYQYAIKRASGCPPDPPDFQVGP